MVKTHTWDVQIAAQTVIAELNPPPQSTYSSIDPQTGQPWLPGQSNAIVAALSIKNIGTTAGTLSWRCYAHANQTGEILLTEGTTTTDINPGSSTGSLPVVVTIPNEPGTSCQFGVKVKGETETTWPAWGLGLQNGQAFIFGGRLITDEALILGVVGIAGLIGILWYTKKKHMW